MTFSLGMAIKGDLRKIFDDEKTLTRNACAAAVKAQAAETKSDLRGVTAPVLGQGIANSWRDRSYRNKGSASPAGFIYSKAPAIIDGWLEDRVIIPKHGRFLAIPTMWNRYHRVSGGREPTVTTEMMVRSGVAFTRPRKDSKPGLLWYLPLHFTGRKERQFTGEQALNYRGNYRSIKITAGGAGATRALARMKPHERELAQRYFHNKAVPMFTLVPEFRRRKLIDLDAALNAAFNRLPDKLSSAYAMLDQGYRP